MRPRGAYDGDAKSIRASPRGSKLPIVRSRPASRASGAEDSHLRIGQIGLMLLVASEPVEDLVPPRGWEFHDGNREAIDERSQPPSQIALGEEKARLAEDRPGRQEGTRPQALEIASRPRREVVPFIDQGHQDVRVEDDQARLRNFSRTSA